MKLPAHAFRTHLCSAPRAHLFTRRAAGSATTCSVPAARRGLSGTSVVLRSNNNNNNNEDSPSSSPSPFGSFGNGAAPPRLPKEEQEIFEALQRASTGAFSTPRPSPPKVNQSPDTAAAKEEVTDENNTQGSKDADNADNGKSKLKELYERAIEARGTGEELHPNVVKGAQPEFEGERNPRTGEIGGPKNEPLRWGPEGEWTYNGRTTDF